MTIGRFALEMAAAPALERVEQARSIAGNARDGARSLWTAMRAFENRHDDRSNAQVGAEWFHSAADRDRALAQLTTDFQIFVGDLDVQLKAARSIAGRDHDGDDAWLRVDVLPTLNEWREFLEKEKASLLTRMTTEWDVFEGWQERLKRLRELARARGLKLASAEPVPFPRTVWERGTTGSGSSTDAMFGVLKVVIYAGIGVTGFVTLYSVLRDLKGYRNR